MKYQSEIIKEIIASKGHLKSLPHYESECVEPWIEEAKGAYPKITDYEGEWLAYINDNNGIGEFPYVSLTDVTEATIENVVPYAYKSAILKGQTLVNLVDKTKSVFSADGNKNLWQNALFNTNPTQLTIINYTDKVIKFAVHNRTTNDWVSTNGVKPNSKSLINCGADKYLKDLYGTYGDGWSNTEEDRNILKNGVLILEGNHTQEDIPYFEGMQSVKMPVLTTINGSAKILANTNLTKTGELSPNNNSNKAIEDYILIPPMDVIVSNVSWLFICFYDENKNFISNTGGTNINKFELNDTTIPDNAKYFRFHYNSSSLPLIRFVNGKDYIKATIDGEPFKSNILTVNEEVTLRSNGSVYDELDLLTGKLTQRIDEDGSVLTQEIVKTVDLTVTDQDGNTKSIIKPIEGTMYVITSSQTLPPLLDISVPVEATTQNLMSFANIIEEEK